MSKCQIEYINEKAGMIMRAIQGFGLVVENVTRRVSKSGWIKATRGIGRLWALWCHIGDMMSSVCNEWEYGVCHGW